MFFLSCRLHMPFNGSTYATCEALQTFSHVSKKISPCHRLSPLTPELRKGTGLTSPTRVPLPLHGLASGHSVFVFVSHKFHGVPCGAWKEKHHQ